MVKDDKAPAQTPAGADDSTPKPEKGKKKKLLMVLGVLVLAGAGYKFMAPGGAAAEAGVPAEPAPPVAGEVVALEPITLNLADGRFLKVGIALQLVEGVAPPDDDLVDGYAAPAMDEAISMLGSMTYTELVAPGARDAAKTALSERIAARYAIPDDPEGDSELLGIYFTELVMQ